MKPRNWDSVGDIDKKIKPRSVPLFIRVISVLSKLIELHTEIPCRCPSEGHKLKIVETQTSEGFIIFNLKWWHRWKLAIIIICIFYHGASPSYRSKKSSVFPSYIILGFSSSLSLLSTRIRIFFNPQRFLSGRDSFCTHASGKFGSNPDIFESATNLITCGWWVRIDKNVSNLGEQKTNMTSKRLSLVSSEGFRIPSDACRTGEFDVNTLCVDGNLNRAWE